MALQRPEPEPEDQPQSPPEPAHNPRRWVIPIGGGLLAAALIVFATPHVVVPLRIALGVIALVYVTGQAASYLWTRDQG